jgi:thiamine-monophosphate kinase
LQGMALGVLKLTQSPEFDWIQRLASGKNSPELIVPNGDDGAVVRFGKQQIVFVKDLLVEGVHFRRDWSNWEQIAHKLIVSNYSDLEAMGAKPIGALLGCCLGGLSQDEQVQLADALRKGFEDWQIPLWGGDTTGGQQLVLSLTLMGELQGNPLRRSQAMPGMSLWLTTALGTSAAGLEVLLREQRPLYEDLVELHLTPSFHPGLGPQLAQSSEIAAMDLSDGLWSTARMIALQSGVQLQIVADLLLQNPRLLKCAQNLGVNPWEWIAQGGEEYTLLIAGFSSDPVLLKLQQEGTLYEMGRVTEGEGALWCQGGQVFLDAPGRAYGHF